MRKQTVKLANKFIKKLAQNDYVFIDMYKDGDDIEFTLFPGATIDDYSEVSHKVPRNVYDEMVRIKNENMRFLNSIYSNKEYRILDDEAYEEKPKPIINI